MEQQDMLVRCTAGLTRLVAGALHPSAALSRAVTCVANEKENHAVFLTSDSGQTPRGGGGLHQCCAVCGQRCTA